MVFGGHRESLLADVGRQAVRHGPRLQHAVEFEPEVVVLAPRAMQLDHESERTCACRDRRARRLGRPVERALLDVARERGLVAVGHGHGPSASRVG
jgi:hypothetical protein